MLGQRTRNTDPCLIDIYDLLALAGDDGIDRGTLLHLLEECVQRSGEGNEKTLANWGAAIFGLVTSIFSALTGLKSVIQRK